MRTKMRRRTKKEIERSVNEEEGMSESIESYQKVKRKDILCVYLCVQYKIRLQNESIRNSSEAKLN